MVSVARATLVFEWRRFLPAVLAVAFSGLLVLIQLALLLGMFGTVTIYVDQSTADLWVGFRDTKSVDLGRNIRSGNEVFLRMHPEVLSVERFRVGAGDWRCPDGTAVSGFVVGLDTSNGAMALSRLLSAELRTALKEPGSVVVDAADLGKLGVKVGDSAEVNGKRVKVVGAVTGVRGIGGVNILTSLANARRLDSSSPGSDATTYFLVRVRDPGRAEAVRDDLHPRGTFRRYSVWTAAAFSAQSQRYWLVESGVGVGFGFSSLLALMVGVAITSQTLMGAVVSSLREYATLRALGISLGSLRAIVLEQSWWVGVAGLAATSLATWAVYALASAHQVAMRIPAWSVLATGAIILAVATGSGLLAVRALYRVEPAALLR
jgi:putative ABC transport system permease protein